MNALILVDIQNDFLPGGALSVPRGDEVIPVANRIQSKFDLVVATQDWHPPDHGSFASNYSGKKVFDRVELGGLEQILWPDHCVQGTRGAAFADSLDMNRVEAIFRKGMDPAIDSYSGFYDNGHRKATGLGDYLKGRGVKRVSLAGLAGDFCVKFSILDTLDLGFEAALILDGVRPIDENDFRKIVEDLRRRGVGIVQGA